MKLSKRKKNIVKSNSFALILSLILEAIVIISIALGFFNLGIGIGSLQILMLIVIDILILILLTKKNYTLELVALVFTFMLFIGPLVNVGRLVIFVLFLYTTLNKARI